MKAVFKDLLGKGLIYGLGSSLSGLAGFLLIPFFIHHLSAAQYGRFALAEMVINLLLVVLGMGMHVALLSRYPRLADEVEKRTLVGSLISFLLLVAIVVVGLYLALSYSGLPFFPELSSEMLLLVAAVSATEMAWLLFATLFRAQGAAWRFITISVAKLVCGLVATVLLIIYIGMREEGILYGRLAGNALMFILLAPQLWHYRPRFNLRPAIDLARIGIPLIPATFATMWISMSPRYFIEWFGDTAAVGVFALSSKISAVLSLLFVSPFAMAWMVALFRIYQREDAKRVYARVMTYYCLVGTTMALALGLISPQITVLLGKEDFPLSPSIITVMALANVASGLMYPSTIGPYVKEKTRSVIPVFLFSGILSLVLGTVMTYWWGSMGACCSLLFIYLVQALVLIKISNSLYPITFETKRIAKGAMSLGVAYVFTYSCVQNIENAFMAIVAPLVFLFILATLLILIRFWEEDEIRVVKLLLAK
ncbi:MAG: lipopolysaccharide biosynthesis protein [Desulfuromonadales bacterium]